MAASFLLLSTPRALARANVRRNLDIVKLVFVVEPALVRARWFLRAFQNETPAVASASGTGVPDRSPQNCSVWRRGCALPFPAPTSPSPLRSDMEVIHPNSKGGYSTVFQRNKAVRTKEMEREAMAQQWIQKNRSTRS